MEFEELYSEEDEELFQPTTNEESYRDNFIDKNFKKWISSDTNISNISSIYRLETENTNRTKTDILKKEEKGEKINEYENSQEINEKEFEENNIKENDEEIEELKEEEIISEDTFEDSNNIKQNYTFVWSEGGNDVKITGSFSDWKIKFQMTNDPIDQIFKCKLPLGNEIYQYKFIVDGEWKFSKNFPIKDDGNGNINNILDNTKKALIQPKEKKNKEKKFRKFSKPKKNKKKNLKNKQSGISTKTRTTKTRASTINKEKITRKNSIYESQYPSDDDILPLPLPNKRYYASFKLENYTNQKTIGNKKYYDYYDRYCFSYEASSRPIFILGHINLNHLISVKHNKSDMLKNSMSFRYREKASTFIYYK